MNLKEVFSGVDLHEGCGVTERPFSMTTRQRNVLTTEIINVSSPPHIFMVVNKI
jgi:hypothetical protein